MRTHLQEGATCAANQRLTDPSAARSCDRACKQTDDAGTFVKCFGLSWAGMTQDLSRRPADTDWTPVDGSYAWWCIRRHDRLMYMGILLCIVGACVLIGVTTVRIAIANRKPTHYAEATYGYANP